MPNPLPSDNQQIEPTRYHRELLEYLRTEESELWNWIASQKAQSDHAAAVRLELLKSTYRIGREFSPEMYAAAESTAARLGHDAPITLYQAQNASELNASLAWLPGEIHVVLYGPVQETLTESELQALFGHEIAHHWLFSIDEGAYLVVEQVLSAMLGDRQATHAHELTWKHFKLYTELLCDRTTLQTTGDLSACVSALVKMQTGLRNVSADAYLNQAEEVLRDGTAITGGVTHPEMFIRARALQLWTDDPHQVEEVLQTIIEGPLTLSGLDLLRQKRVTRLTRDLLDCLLAPDWIRTDSLLAHAGQFFEGFGKSEPAAKTLDELRAAVATGDDPFRHYFCYLLLDFVTSDPDLEEAPLAAALLLVRDLGIEDEFLQISGKELRLSKRQFESIRKNASKIVAQAEKQASAT